MLLQEELRQRSDIFAPLPKGRHVNLDGAQAMKQIGAESAGVYGFLEVHVTGSHHTHVGGHLARSTQPVIGYSIENSEQLHLRLGIELADFIQENRSVIGSFEQSLLHGVGAAEGAFLISEQLTLNEMFRQSSAIQIHPRLGAAQRIVMNSAGNKLFATAAFAANQDGYVSLRHLNHQLHQLLHRLARNYGGKPHKALQARSSLFILSRARASKHRLRMSFSCCLDRSNSGHYCFLRRRVPVPTLEQFVTTIRVVPTIFRPSCHTMQGLCSEFRTLFPTSYPKLVTIIRARC